MNKWEAVVRAIRKEPGEEKMNDRYCEEVGRYLLWRYAVQDVRLLADARQL